MRLSQSLALVASCASTAYAVTLAPYEYVIVGSGAGGGPLAARLALAGHKTLLIEAGDDQGSNVNYTVPAYQAKSTEDPAISWDFFVRHYADDARQKLDYKLTYNLPGGGEYTGLNPPAGATIKGILYPRAGTLGGCTAHNALVTVYPDRDDFDNVAALTGDASWSASNMRNYFVKLENNHYLNGVTGHGFAGWLSIQQAPLNLAVADSQLTSQLLGAAQALQNQTNVAQNLGTLAAGDANADSATRDSQPALYQVPISTNNAHRNGAREFLLSVANAKNFDGSKKYPLDIRLNCYVTKVTFDNASPPRATGVQFLDGKSLYRADPRAKSAQPGIPGSVQATREVVIAGGSYNSPQILKLSGIGPAAELQKFGIKVVKDSPGVGTNLQDHYEVAVQTTTPKDYAVLSGCNFGFAGDGKPIPASQDPCYGQWQFSPGTSTYASSGFAGAVFYKSSTSPDGNYDAFEFGGPVNFRGYFPGYSYNATAKHNYWSWAILKSHPRNTAGSVTLASADPLDMPNILYNYFDTGSGDYNADLNTITEAIRFARAALKASNLSQTEVLPGANVQSTQDIQTYAKNTAWGHHCSCTVPIGRDGDPMAVLDSSFRVRGVQGLRVIDASVWPKIPGVFTMLSTYLVSEKGADVMLQQINQLPLRQV